MLAGRAESFWNHYFERVILHLLDLPSGARVLDVGAGNSALTFLLARLRPNLELTGLDLTVELVAAGNAEAAKRGLGNAKFSQGDALHLPFEEAGFDAVVCQTLLVWWRGCPGLSWRSRRSSFSYPSCKRHRSRGAPG